MILAAVDDLMFGSKIREAARQLGVDVRFARSAQELIEHVHTDPPALLIVDLNSQRLQPLACVAALKAEPATASIRTLGFVSHVRADLISAARDAGVDEVMARSAFSVNLPAILASGR